MNQLLSQVVHKQLGVMRTQLEALAARVAPVVPLSPIQRWFFSRNLPRRNHCNLAWLVATDEPLAPVLMAEAVRRLAVRHPILRQRFVQGPGGWSSCGGARGPEFVSWDLKASGVAERSETIERVANEAQSGLDLEAGPVVRVVHLAAAGEDRLLVVAHHLVADLYSGVILLEDLAALYDRLCGVERPLPPAPPSFATWTARLAAHVRGGAMQAELPYWQAVGAAEVAAVAPGDPGRLAEEVFVQRTLDAAETGRLWQGVPRAFGVPAATAAMWAVARALAAVSGAERVRFDVEGHGREALFSDLDVGRTVGWFTCLYPLLLAVDAHAPLDVQLRAVHAQTRAVPNGGIGHGLLQSCGGGTGTEAPGDVCFNFTGREPRHEGGQRGRFRPAPESAGERHHPSEPRPYGLELSVGERGGQLCIEARSNVFHAARAERVVEQVRAHLAQLCAAAR